MTTKLAGYIKQERVKQGLNYAELSKKMGYTNINRGMRRIFDLEREGIVHHEVLEKIIDALELDKEYIDQKIQEDKEHQLKVFHEWVNTPIKRYLIIRWVPAVYGEKDIPGFIKTEEAIEYAVGVAKELKSMIWLVLSRRVNYHINENGNIKSRNEVTINNSWLPSAGVR